MSRFSKNLILLWSPNIKRDNQQMMEFTDESAKLAKLVKMLFVSVIDEQKHYIQKFHTIKRLYLYFLTFSTSTSNFIKILYCLYFLIRDIVRFLFVKSTFQVSSPIFFYLITGSVSNKRVSIRKISH